MTGFWCIRLPLKPIATVSILISAFIALIETSAQTKDPKPVTIENSGEISIDQDAGIVTIGGDVKVHQAPFYLEASKVLWRQEESIIEASGGIRLLLDTTEVDEESSGFVLEDPAGVEASLLRELLRANQIIYSTKDQVISPVGTAIAQVGIARIVSDDLSYSLDDQAFSSNRYRVGMNNLFIEGDSLSVAGETLAAEGTQFFFGEPEAWSIQGYASSFEKREDDSIELKGVWMKLGPVPFFYWPSYVHNTQKPKFSVKAEAGYSGDLGVFLSLQPTYRPSEKEAYFLDIDIFSERGTLIGPGFDLDFSAFSNHKIQTKLESGFINDSGQLGFDVFGQPIEPNRNYIDFDYLHKIGSQIQILGKFQKWSDSEILRDFDPGRFESIQQPETYLEAIWQSGNWAISHFSQFRHEDFEFATEKLPEFKAQLLPSPIPFLPAYHSLLAEASFLKNSDPDHLSSIEYNRFRAHYSILVPIRLNNWLDLIPLATFQTMSFDKVTGFDETLQRNHFEVGFDLNAYVFGEWDTQNAVWGINGIRHQLKPTLQFRSVSISGDIYPSFSLIERRIFRTGLDDIDLTSNRHLDDLGKFSMLRVGVFNTLSTQGKDGDPDERIQFDLFHDLYFQDEPIREEDSLWVANIKLEPAYWLNLSVQSRFSSNAFELNDLFGRLSIIDGDAWELDVATQFLETGLQQYIFDFQYKVNEDLRLVSSVGYDAENSRFFEQIYGVQIGVANYWDFLLSVKTRVGSTRNNDTRFEFKILPARF